MQDFILDITDLLDALNNNREAIEKVEYIADENLRVSPDFPEHFEKIKLLA